MYQESLALSEALRERLLNGLNMYGLGAAALEQGDLAQASALQQQSLAIFDEAAWEAAWAAGQAMTIEQAAYALDARSPNSGA